MKLRIFIHFVIAILLTTMLVVTNAVAQETSLVESTATRPEDDHYIASANALLKPPNTASPRATLKSFIENMNRAYGMLMKAHRKNLKTPGYFPSEAVRQMAKQAEEFFQSGVECLNLSQVPKNLKKNTGYEGAIMLKEVFDRIKLPPFEKIPDAAAIEAEEEKEKIAELSRWRIPNTDIIIDDAFRVGDYIETSGQKGTVEHISLRSLRLRNPRGPVHTIPFGSMGTVTNNSRDYIISKLDFRVRYDTDVDKVRKIIKKINLVITKDPEMGLNLLDKIKSQGVKELDDSAMIMRLKFKTIHGEQFVIRREVFRMIQESFRENGIEFAHRNVTVYLPPDEEADEQDKKVIEAGAAAAAVAAQADADAKTAQKQ